MRRLVLLAILLAVACKSKSTPPPAAKDAGVAATMPTTKIIQPDGVVTLPEPVIELPRQEAFKLIAPGAAPRTKLRYRWKQEVTRQVVAQAEIRSRRLTSGTWSAPTTSPPLDEGFAVTLAPATGGGATVLLRGMPTTTQGGDAAARWKALVENKRAQMPIDDRGQVGTVVLAEDPSGAASRASTDEIVQRWLTATVPLPAEPVGKGARWKVVTVLRSGEAVIKQTAEYTLVEVRKNGWVLDVSNKRVAEQQTMIPAGMPRGTLAELVALFRILEGRVTVAPDMPWATGALTAELRVHGRLAVPGAPVEEHVTEDTGTIRLSTR